MSNGHNKHDIVDSRREDMSLFREVAGSSDDVVASFLNLGDKGTPIAVWHYCHMVAYSHRIGSSQAFEAEVALDLAWYEGLSFIAQPFYLVNLDQIPATSISDDKSGHPIILT